MADPNPYLSLVPSDEPAPPTPSQANPYMALVDGASPDTPARLSMMQVANTNPDVEARIQALGKQYGVPTETVRLQQPDYERRATIDSIDYGKLAKEAPATSNLLQQPKTAGISYDDTENLSAIERAVQTLSNIGRSAAAAVPSIAQGFYGVVQAGAEGMAALTQSGTGTPSLSEGPLSLAARLLPENPFERVAQGVAEWRRGQEALAKSIRPKAQGIAESGLYSGVESAVQSGAALLTGQPGLALGALAGVQGGQSYGQARDKGVDPAQAAAFGASQAAIEYATEKIPVSRFLSDFKAGTPFFNMVARQMAAEIPGELVATTLQNLNEWAVLNPEKPFKSYTDQLPADLAQTVIATVVSVGALSGAARSAQAVSNRFSRRQEEASQAQASAAALTEADALTAESKMRPRDAATFNDFIRQAAADGPVQDVYIDVQSLAQSGVDVAALAAVSPAVAQQLPEATAAGGTVRIPLDEFTTNVAGTDLSAPLIPYLKTDPLGMNQKEAEEFMQSGADQFRAEVERTLAVQAPDEAFKQSRDAVQARIMGELDVVNRFTPAVNQNYAALMANFYAVQGARLGITPEEMAARYPIRFAASDVTGGGAQLSQEDAERRQTNATTQPISVGEARAIVAGRTEKPGGVDPAGMIGINDGYTYRIGDVPLGLRIDRDGLLAEAKSLTARIKQRANADRAQGLDQISEETLALNRADSERVSEIMRTLATPQEAPAQPAAPKQPAWYGDATAAQRSALGRLNADTGAHGFDIRAASESINQAAQAQFNAYEIAPGVKEIPIAEFGLAGYQEANEQKRIAKLAEDIQDSKEIEPIFVGLDPDGQLYVIEGQHRARAFLRMGRDTVPARVIVDMENAEAPDQVQQGERGSLSVPADITQQAPILTLLENADLSTFLHESGHFYLEVMSDLAARLDAPQEIKDDMDAILKWFGVPDLATWRGMTLNERREQHEQFARGFEAYLFEGKSPSQELRQVFQKFRAWLVNVYRTLARLNVQLTDEVRSVFDRMLATSDAIAEQQVIEGAAPLFETKPATMTDAEWTSYQNLNNEAQQDALQNLETRSLRDMKWLNNARSRVLKDLQKQADSARAAVRSEVEAEVYATPLYSTMQFLRRGTATIEGEQIQAEAGHKLDIDALKEAYPEGALGSLAWEKLGYGRYGMLGKDGLSPDLVAQMFGYTSGDQLVRSLIEAEPVDSVIEGMTDARMLERHGDLTDKQSMSRAVDEALHNEARARFVATELNALQQATGQKKILASAARQFAERMIARLRVRDVRPGQYTSAEGRAAREADRAIKKGDIETAALEKRNQLVNTYAAKAAYAAQNEISKDLDYLKKFGKESTRKSIDPSYIDQIDSLLERFDLRTGQSLKAIDKRKSLAEWVQAQEEQGLTPIIDDALLNEARRQSYKDMTVEELRGLVDAVKNIEHLGRLKKKLLTAKDQRDFQQAVNELRTSIEANAKGVVPEQRSSDRGLLVKPARLFRQFKAMHRKFASFAREFDGWKDAGPAWDYLVRGMNTAGDNEAVANEKATVKLTGMFDALLKDGKLGRKTFVPEIGQSLTREQMIGVALNMGNTVNRERVMTGENWSQAQLAAVLDKLTENNWKFVQEALDYIGSYKTEIAAKERRLTGVEPEWVEAEPIQTKYGEFPGGYYPIAYDPNLSSRSEADIAAQVQRQMQQGLYTRAQTRRGHLKARTESTGRRLRLDLNVLSEHVQQVIHDLSWHEYLIDANRLLRDGGIDEAVRQHYGVDSLKEMRDTLKDIAIGNQGATNALDKIFNHLRTGATVAGLGWRLTTSLMQPLGLTQSMVRIGPKWVLKGASHWAAGTIGLEKGMKAMYEMSPFMRLRGKTMQREINEIQNKVTGEPVWKQKLHASYFLLIQKAQAIADVPTWWGAYEKAMAEQEMTEGKAIALADQAVRDAQGHGQIGDLAGIQRGGTGLKLFTSFYSFFNTTYNLTAEAVGRTDFKSPKQVGLLAVDLALLYMIPAMLGTAMKATLHGDWDDKDKVIRTFIADQLNYLLGTMVGLRELGGAAQAAVGAPGGDYSGPASVRFFAEVAKLAKQANQGEADHAFFKALANVAGVLFHLPAGQVMATVDGVGAIADGRTENPGAILVGAPPK